jgi:hypothetical protein
VLLRYLVDFNRAFLVRSDNAIVSDFDEFEYKYELDLPVHHLERNYWKTFMISKIIIDLPFALLQQVLHFL